MLGAQPRQGVGMCSYTSRAAALALLVGALACSDRPPGTAPDAAGGPNVLSTATNPELLARSLALALGDPAFRAHVKGELDRSPFREHKLSFQRFLAAGRGHALAAMALRTGVATADLGRAAEGAIPLEMYLPVPEHRRIWKGDSNVLVATSVADHDPPVAFDVQGNRLVLDPERPPATPVIAVVPVETDFSTTPAAIECMSCGSLWLPPPPPTAPGLNLTKAHFADDFEGWLKGGPDFEVHILGQRRQTDSLTDYQCAGETQPTPHYFDQNALDWSGSVMLFSEVQLDAYNAAERVVVEIPGPSWTGGANGQTIRESVGIHLEVKQLAATGAAQENFRLHTSFFRSYARRARRRGSVEHVRGARPGPVRRHSAR